MADILSHATEFAGPSNRTPYCVREERSHPLFKAVPVGCQPHQLCSPGPMHACQHSMLIYIFDEISLLFRIFTQDGYFLTYFKRKLSEAIFAMFVSEDAVFAVTSDCLHVSDAMAQYTDTFPMDLTTLDVSENYVYLGNRDGRIISLNSTLDILISIKLDTSHLSHEAVLSGIRVVDDSFIYAIYNKSTFPFQIFTTDGSFLRYVSLPGSMLASISINQFGYVAICDGASKSVKIFNPDLKLVHSLDIILELKTATFLENFILATNSSQNEFKLFTF